LVRFKISAAAFTAEFFVQPPPPKKNSPPKFLISQPTAQEKIGLGLYLA